MFHVLLRLICTLLCTKSLFSLCRLVSSLLAEVSKGRTLILIEVKTKVQSNLFIPGLAIEKNSVAHQRSRELSLLCISFNFLWAEPAA